MKYFTTLLFTIIVFYNCDNTTDEETVIVSSNFKSEMLAEINEIRRSGCRCGERWYPPAPTLSWNALLEDAAIRHARDMSTNFYFDHEGTDGSSIDQRITDTGYHWAAIAENIAKGQNSIKLVVESWKESPAHCMNIMSPKYSEMGSAEKNNYWVQTFGSPR